MGGFLGLLVVLQVFEGGIGVCVGGFEVEQVCVVVQVENECIDFEGDLFGIGIGVKVVCVDCQLCGFGEYFMLL